MLYVRFQIEAGPFTSMFPENRRGRRGSFTRGGVCREDTLCWRGYSSGAAHNCAVVTSSTLVSRFIPHSSLAGCGKREGGEGPSSYISIARAWDVERTRVSEPSVVALQRFRLSISPPCEEMWGWCRVSLLVGHNEDRPLNTPPSLHIILSHDFLFCARIASAASLSLPACGRAHWRAQKKSLSLFAHSILRASRLSPSNLPARVLCLCQGQGLNPKP